MRAALIGTVYESTSNFVTRSANPSRRRTTPKWESRMPFASLDDRNEHPKKQEKASDSVIVAAVSHAPQMPLTRPGNGLTVLPRARVSAMVPWCRHGSVTMRRSRHSESDQCGGLPAAVVCRELQACTRSRQGPSLGFWAGIWRAGTFEDSSSEFKHL